MLSLPKTGAAKKNGWLFIVNCEKEREGVLKLLLRCINDLFCTANQYIFSSHEPKAHGELIGYPWSGVRRPLSVRPSPVPRSQFQTSSSPKPLDRSKPNFMWSLLG